MTEQEWWEGCNDPEELLWSLRGQFSERKERLLAEEHIEHPAPGDVGAGRRSRGFLLRVLPRPADASVVCGAAEVGEDRLVVAAGVLEGVGQDGEALWVQAAGRAAGPVGGPGQFPDGAAVPGEPV